jgi:hypothetical protein
MRCLHDNNQVNKKDKKKKIDDNYSSTLLLANTCSIRKAKLHAIPLPCQYPSPFYMSQLIPFKLNTRTRLENNQYRLMCTTLARRSLDHLTATC